MSHYTALLDANVLYPAPLRDLFLQLAVTDLFKTKWSADIHREWIEALLRNEPQRDRLALERTRDLMDKATRDSLIAGYESLIPALSLPDPNDRHVLAAAIVGHCDVIVGGDPGVADLHCINISPIDPVMQYLFATLESPQTGNRWFLLRPGLNVLYIPFREVTPCCNSQFHIGREAKARWTAAFSGGRSLTTVRQMA